MVFNSDAQFRRSILCIPGRLVNRDRALTRRPEEAAAFIALLRKRKRHEGSFCNRLEAFSGRFFAALRMTMGARNDDGRSERQPFSQA